MQSMRELIKFAVEYGVVVFETVQQVVSEEAAFVHLVLLLLQTVE